MNGLNHKEKAGSPMTCLFVLTHTPNDSANPPLEERIRRLRGTPRSWGKFDIHFHRRVAEHAEDLFYLFAFR